MLGQHATLDTPTDIIGRDYVSVLDDQMAVDDGGGTATSQADVQLTNPSLRPITVTLRLTHLQDTDHTRSFVTAVPAETTMSVPAGLLCDGSPPASRPWSSASTGTASLSTMPC